MYEKIIGKIRMFAIIVIIITIIIFAFDYFNLGIISITRDYDWLNYLGSLISFAGTIIISLLAFYENKELKDANDNLNKINQRMYEDNLKVLGFLNTDFMNDQFLYTFYDDDGFKMIPKESILNTKLNEEIKVAINKESKIKLYSGDHNVLRFIINLEENNNKNIESFYFDDLELFYGVGLKDSVKFLGNEKKYSSVEKEKNNKYNLTIILMIPMEVVKEIELSEEIKFHFNLKLKNCSNIVTPSWNEIVVINTKQEIIGDRIRYILKDKEKYGRSPRTKYGQIFHDNTKEG